MEMIIVCLTHRILRQMICETIKKRVHTIVSISYRTEKPTKGNQFRMYDLEWKKAKQLRMCVDNSTSSSGQHLIKYRNLPRLGVAQEPCVCMHL